MNVLDCGTAGPQVVCYNYSLCYRHDSLVLALVGWFSFIYALFYAASSDWYFFLMQDSTPSSFAI